MDDFASRYGQWAVVAGASEGLGAAFAECLAQRRMNLLLIARRGELLRTVAADLTARYGVETRCLVQDLADAAPPAILAEAGTGLDIGVLVYNAAFIPVGRFVDLEQEALEQLVRVNVQGPVTVLRTLLPAMVARRRGAVVLMSSMAAMQGAPRIAGYAASKAFNATLGEGLWAELREQGIDVVACCAGAMPTPGYARSFKRSAPGMMAPEKAAELTLAALGKGPRFIPGRLNRAIVQMTARLLPPRRWPALPGLFPESWEPRGRRAADAREQHQRGPN